MNIQIGDVLFAALSLVALVGAFTVVATRDVMRLTLGLGAFLMAIAGFFALFGFGFLALAELFVYVGGVLVLVLFAVMLVHRGQPGSPDLASRHDATAMVACAGLFGFIVISLRSVAPTAAGIVKPGALGALLLGDMLPQFWLVGMLLLAALVAVVAVGGGDRE